MTRAVSTARVLDEQQPTVTNGTVKFSEVKIDPRVQRPKDEGWQARIAADFDPDALGTVTISVRRNGDQIVLDGQQRMGAAEIVGYDGEVMANFYRGLSLKQEAALFRRLNFKKNVPVINKFLVSLNEGNPQSLAIKALLDALGIEVVGTGGFTAIGTAQRIAGWDDKGIIDLRWALGVMVQVWGPEGRNLDGRIIEALALWHHRDGDTETGGLINTAMLCRKLAGRGMGQPGILGEARTWKTVQGGRLVVNLADVLIGTYNVKLSKNELPQWQRSRKRAGLAATDVTDDLETGDSEE